MLEGRPYSPGEEDGMQIEGRSALITGGSRGLGAALGHALAREGARVVLVARQEEELARVVEAIRAEGGDAHHDRA